MKLKVGIGQFCASSYWKSNFDIVSKIATLASKESVDALFLPEAADWISVSDASYDQLCSASVQFSSSMVQLSRSLGIWIFFGVHQPSTTDGRKLFNSHLAVSSGKLVAEYRKIHLFDYPSANLYESDRTIGGNRVEDPVRINDHFRCGLEICYDLRFPELSLALRQMQANVLTFPSAFTVPTGRSHWEILLRARAIENQSFVIAAAQMGNHEHGRKSWGQSMVIDPSGTVLTKCSSYDSRDHVGCVLVEDGFELGIAELDSALLVDIREKMPMDLHRRNRGVNLRIDNLV